MTYTQKVQLINNVNSNNQNFRQQIEAAVAKQAIYMLDGGGSPTAAMKTHALMALSNPAAEVNRFAWYCAFDGNVESVVNGGSTLTDAQIQTVIDAKASIAWAI